MVGGSKSYTSRVQALAPIAYWPFWEVSDTTATDASGNSRTGTYSSDVSTWPIQSGIGDGHTAPDFDGTNDYVGAYSVSLRAAFDGTEGSVIGWAKVSGSGTWIDGNTHIILDVGGDANNYVMVYKGVGANRLDFVYQANATFETIQVTMSPIAWFHWAITWSDSADEVKAYVDGSQQGTTQTSVGTWGVPLSLLLIGTTAGPPNMTWEGGIAHTAIFDRALLAGEIVEVASL